MNEKQKQLLGLMQRAGALKTGEEQCIASVQKRRAKAVILASDAGVNTSKVFHNKCHSYQVPLYRGGTKEEMGRALGKESRVAAAVEDSGFAEAYRKQEEKRES
ncbi:L7Ae/L30e/S12e/Gadd45 family ribosomal protein [Alkalicoccus chagannorensis]|uniref:L7Ae/L30e/S12e/Gadd45 family ribosomal protein n=1 Tax=Alkalicoccus chagannorensis TaxID=427072 RepID=UPI000419575C|nr:ribosomal L7Ae/L30e/S12e/Gadd45 family protein [Alkalicoccus chagannorensis]